MTCTSAANAGFPIDREHIIKKHRKSVLGFTSDIICIVRLGRDDSFQRSVCENENNPKLDSSRNGRWMSRMRLYVTQCPTTARTRSHDRLHRYWWCGHESEWARAGRMGYSGNDRPSDQVRQNGRHR